MSEPMRLLSLLVENHEGVLNRVTSMIRRRGFNIDSLSVGETQDPTVSRMTIQVHVGQQQAAQAAGQVAKLIDVIRAQDITEARVVAHELLLVKIADNPDTHASLLSLLERFHARIVDIDSGMVIVEVTGARDRLNEFMVEVGPLGILELARSGAVAMLRGEQEWLVEAAQAVLPERVKSSNGDIKDDIMGAV